MVYATKLRQYAKEVCFQPEAVVQESQTKNCPTLWMRSARSKLDCHGHQLLNDALEIQNSSADGQQNKSRTGRTQSCVCVCVSVQEKRFVVEVVVAFLKFRKAHCGPFQNVECQWANGEDPLRHAAAAA